MRQKIEDITPLSLPVRDCVAIGESVMIVILNEVKNLII